MLDQLVMASGDVCGLCAGITVLCCEFWIVCFVCCDVMWRMIMKIVHQVGSCSVEGACS